MQTLVLVSLLNEHVIFQNNPSPWFFTYELLYEEMRVALNNSWMFVILFTTRWLVDKNSPSTWTYDDFESLSVEVLNHLTRRKLGKDFTFVSLS